LTDSQIASEVNHVLLKQKTVQGTLQTPLVNKLSRQFTSQMLGV
jgi:hypothetical protein